MKAIFLKAKAVTISPWKFVRVTRLDESRVEPADAPDFFQVFYRGNLLSEHSGGIPVDELRGNLRALLLEAREAPKIDKDSPPFAAIEIEIEPAGMPLNGETEE